jgi:hypothetical protein
MLRMREVVIARGRVREGHDEAVRVALVQSLGARIRASLDGEELRHLLFQLGKRNDQVGHPVHFRRGELHQNDVLDFFHPCLLVRR